MDAIYQLDLQNYFMMLILIVSNMLQALVVSGTKSSTVLSVLALLIITIL